MQMSCNPWRSSLPLLTTGEPFVKATYDLGGNGEVVVEAFDRMSEVVLAAELEHYPPTAQLVANEIFYLIIPSANENLTPSFHLLVRYFYSQRKTNYRIFGNKGLGA